MAIEGFSKEIEALLKQKKEPAIVTVPSMCFLMVDGKGDPRGTEYMQSIEVLYGLSFTMKFMLKKTGGAEFKVMPLEGLWWSDDMNSFILDARGKWKWTSMIMQPDMVRAEDVEKAKAELERKKDPPALPLVRFERFDEGLCAQVLHIGPYTEEGPTVAKLHEFIEKQGYRLRGKHHEIYMGDPRRASPEKLKTIIRQPIEKM